jgi:hypothetical protein
MFRKNKGHGKGLSVCGCDASRLNLRHRTVYLLWGIYSFTHLQSRHNTRHTTTVHSGHAIPYSPSSS